MRIIDPSFQIETDPTIMYGALIAIEKAGRTCYKSEDRIGDQQGAEEFVARIMKSGHQSVIEHVNVTVRFITNRGVTHEIVRHRLASYSQESTRYCNYAKDKFGNEITLIRPYWWNHVGINEEGDINLAKAHWKCAMENAETRYFELLKSGLPAQAARGVLPNDLKTEIVMTANLREWLHFFRLRTAAAAHPDLRLLSVPLLAMFRQHIPVIYDDIRAVEVKRR